MLKPDEKLEAHVIVDATTSSPVDTLQKHTGLGKQRIKNAMKQGAVWLTRGQHTQRLRRASRALNIGDELHLYYDAGILAEIPPEPALIADCDTYSVWRKPYGLRSQGSKWGDHCALVRWVEQHLKPERPAFTVHRLDRAANGLMLVAHSKTTAAALAQLFRDRQIDKRYRAIVTGDCSSLATPLRIESEIDGKVACSEVSLMQVSTDHSQALLEVRIETGRKHQIRRHLAELGHPVLGDRLYGSGATDAVDLQLTAYSIAFECPVTHQPVAYTLPGEWLPALQKT